ncbi:related to ABC multidrug transporter [Cephalotrichum gorgonifer]|uniref:Related to ABC multidrug transporter n=1 Tax=Cephalotrichum gorgonifer TaxID=2041049 RepID=A0AAE8N6A2_9PEZI|nr:related to ABC multidrug transporter [Cephalotrichum gorgonifer]
MSVDCVAIDNTWGPWAGACRWGLDFTLLFEESVFSILPSALLLLLSPVQITWLMHKNKRVEMGTLLPVKQGLIIILGLLKLSLLVIWIVAGPPRTRATLAAETLNFVAVFAISAVSFYEHVYRVAPSILLEIYLLLTIGFDAVRIRTLWLMPGAEAVAAIETVTLATKLGVAVAEGWSKKDLVQDPDSKYSREQLAGFYGRTLFLWLADTLWSGYHRPLNDSDLAGPRDEESAEQLRNSFRQIWSQNPNKEANSALFWTLFRSMPGHFLLPMIPRIAVVGITLAQPMLLERMLDFVQGGGYAQRQAVGYSLVGAFASLYCLTAVFNAWFHHASNKLALELRSQLIDAIYRHLLRLRLSALDTGKATTLINVDMQHIIDGSLILHDIWASFLTVAVAVYLLYLQIQLAFIAPLLCTLLMTVVGGLFGGPIGSRQVSWLAATESRVKATMSMISSFKEVKMLGLSLDYLKSLQNLRLDEVRLGRRFRRILSVIIVLSAASTELSILVAYGGFAIISKVHGVELTPQTIFASLALLRISLDPLFLLIQGTPTLVSMFKCLGRIQDLLNDDTFASIRSRGSHASSMSSLLKRRPTDSPGSYNPYPLYLQHVSHLGFAEFTPAADVVEISDATFCWKDRETPSLYVMSLSLQPASFAAIIGPVGSGKSTLLRAILGEVEQTSGSRRVRPNLRIAYCDQEPWLLDQSIRENIVGSLPFDEEWYETVVAASALTQDIAGLTKGDDTGVGSGGSGMSGGQRARIALARALYCRPELLLLDDIFSGLDRRSAQHIFASLFSPDGLLTKLQCAVALATHSTKFLSSFETIFVVNNGFITHQAGYPELLAEGLVVEETMADLEAPITAPPLPENGKEGAASTKDAMVEKDKDTQPPSDWSVYVYFFRSCGLAGMSLFFVLAAILAAERSFENVWLKMWAESTGDRLTFYITIFTGLIIGGLVLLYALCFFFFDILLTSSALNLYFGQLETLMKSSITYVISAGSTTIANRFIQDIMLVDDELPMALVNTTTALFGALAESVIVFISSKYVSVSVPVLVGFLFIIQKFYLRTSKQLRLMDIEAKAPLSAFMLETIQGIVSIRAFDRTAEFSRKNTARLDYSQKAMYMLLSVQVWLKMILDFVVAVLAVLVTTLAVKFRSTQSLGFLGLALVNLISLSNSFKYLITFWAQLETSIGAVARIQRFNLDVEPEEKGELPPTYPSWPGRGDIQISNVSATYSSSLTPALLDVTLHIPPGTKVAICGRSGSGKSSLLGTLLRCLDLTSGTIIIDGQDISRVSRDSLRKQVMTLPQKALFINDSIRKNMTLWDSSSLSPAEVDAEIESVLRRVGIWDALFAPKESAAPCGPQKVDLFSSSSSESDSKKEKDAKEDKEEEPLSLDSHLNPEERLSTGQQQLFCLARALFQRRTSQIVLMDEFTSSMDHETEMVIRQIVRDDLRDKTVIEVIHRLEHIISFDLVVVVDKGRIVESGHPRDLLQEEGGLLRELYQASKA